VENFGHVNLHVLETYARRWPGLPLGLSDHTPGHVTVLGAIALGARVIEKHFTDDNERGGPDHGFSMDQSAWREMVDRSRELEAALGDGVKRIEDNERKSAVVQRRCVRLARGRQAGEMLQREDLAILRPAPTGALEPHEVSSVVGRHLARDKVAGDALYEKDLAG
jgi:sialic acid synthase SpsE